MHFLFLPLMTCVENRHWPSSVFEQIVSQGHQTEQLCVWRSYLIICSETFTPLFSVMIMFVYIYFFLSLTKKGHFLLLLSLHVKFIVQLDVGSC